MGKGQITGVGDIIAEVTSFFGIVPCFKCNERRVKANLKWPVKLRPRQLTDEELSEWRHYQKIRTLRLDTKTGDWLCKIYSDVFQVPLFPFCSTCSASPYLRMIERMDKIIQTYEG